MANLTKTKGPIIETALCRCCRSIKRCRLLTSEYTWMEKKEIYIDMIMDCFGIVISNLDDDEKDAGVCATCISRLREACAFKSQVLQSEQLFIQTRIIDHKADIVTAEIKAEPLDDNADFHNDVDTQDSIDFEINKNENILDLKAEQETIDHDKNSDIIAQTEQNNSEINLVKEKKKTIKDGAKNHKVMSKKKSKNTKAYSKTKTKITYKQETVKEKRVIDSDDMVFKNAVTIIKNSYICPFHNRVSNYYCFYCKEQFTDPIELRDHTLNHDVDTFESMLEYKRIPKIDITRIDCRLCDVKIDNINTFKSHITTAHKIFLYGNVNEFLLKFKLDIDSLKCTECESSFPYFDLLQKHMRDHFGRFVCDLCGACFLEQVSLNTHIKSHSKVEKDFPCEICGKNLKSKYSRFSHIATVHEKKATVNCYKCEEVFLSYALRNRHLIEAHGDKRTFPCKLCDKVYNRRKSLMEHNRRTHLKVNRHQCDYCEQKFYLPSRLKEHLTSHTGERMFKCDVCRKCFNRLTLLQEHLRSHTGEKVKCNVCEASCNVDELTNHLKTHHDGYGLEGLGQV